ncbi:T6SS effector BTH_I2691 family protein [Enterobacteriaceae bacterium LUAb1]
MTAKCTVCLSTGPVLMPVRYAIVPDSVSQGLPAWAVQPAATFPALPGCHYALRCMRQGFIYVYYDTGAKDLHDWEVWSVDEKGNLYRTANVLGARAIFSPLPCTRPMHQATSLEHMALSEHALQYETWVAFSHAPWTQETAEKYTFDPLARAQRMQNIHPSEWNASGTTFDSGLNRASEATLNAVLDYCPDPNGRQKYPLSEGNDADYQISYIENGRYHFFEESIRPHTTLHPWVRNRRQEGAASRTMKAMQNRSLGPDGKPVYPLIIALHDPVGITHELTSWCDGLVLTHQCYLEELTVEFATWRNINGVKSQVQQGLSARQKQYAENNSERNLQQLYQEMGNSGYSREQLRQFYLDGMASANRQRLESEWKKYDQYLNHAKLNQFTGAYDQFCQLTNNQLNQLVELRLEWLQNSRFLPCLDDHHTSLTRDHLSYREIVGYAVASINIVPAGRRRIQQWINEYSTASKANLFWRSQFFNDPVLMQDTATLLATMKAESAQKDPPDKAADRTSTQSALNSVMSALGKYGESCDRALDALEKDSKSANVSLTRKILAYGDRRLTTFTREVFNKTVIGARLDSINELIYKWLFARDAGVEEKAIRALINGQLDPGPQGATAFRKAVMRKYAKNTGLPMRDIIANKYSDDFEKFFASSEAKRHIDISRIKLLGVFLNAYEFAAQLDEVQKGNGSASGLLSSALFTVSAGMQTALPAFETMEKVAEANLPEPLHHLSAQGAKFSTWMLRASACGSLAAGLAVLNDLGALGDSFEKDGAKFLQAVGLASVKIMSDGAFAIQSSEQWLKLLGHRGIITLLQNITTNTTNAVSLLERLGIRLLLGSISVLASWQVMVLVTIAPIIVAIFTDDELQEWCEQCIFGTDSEVKNTERMSAEERTAIRQQQEDKLVNALHNVLGLPLSEKLQREKEQKKLNQLKAEVQALQHIHN